MTRIDFTDTPAFEETAYILLYGVVYGGSLGRFISVKKIEAETAYAFHTAQLAYQASNGDVAPAWLAAFLSVDLGIAKQQVFNRLTKANVPQPAIDIVTLDHGKPVNYHMLWEQEVGIALIRNFPSMGLAPQVAILAYISTLLERLDSANIPISPQLHAGAAITARAILPLAEKASLPLTGQLALSIRRSEAFRLRLGS